MKTLLFTDLHLGLSKDNTEFHKISLDFADWMVDKIREHKIDNIICCGDVFHNRVSINLSTLHTAYQFFDKLREFDVRIITGNHDCLYKNNSSIHSINLLSEWDNITVYDKPTVIQADGVSMGFVPWGTPLEDIPKCDVMFGHFEITGFQMGLKSVCKEGMNATELLKKSNKIISGHFHKPQVKEYKAGSITYLGSPFQHNWGEAEQDKFIYILNDDLSLTPIENTLSPRHITINSGSDLKASSIKNNFIKLNLDEENPQLMEQIQKCSPRDLQTIVSDGKIIQMAEGAVKEFKGYDIMEAFEVVAKELDDVDENTVTEILNRVRTYYQSVV